MTRRGILSAIGALFGGLAVPFNAQAELMKLSLRIDRGAGLPPVVSTEIYAKVGNDTYRINASKIQGIDGRIVGPILEMTLKVSGTKL